MLVCVMHISNEKTDRRVLLRRLAHICELHPGEARMLVDDDMICENIDLADRDEGFADVEWIELPVRYARHDILIEELARVEHPSEVSTLTVLLEGVGPRFTLLYGFQSQYFRPQPLDLVGGFAHRGPGVGEVNRNAVGLLTQPLHYVFRFLDHCSPNSCTSC